MFSPFHDPDHILLDKLRNDLRLFKIMLLDMIFMDSDFQPDTDRNGENENEAGNENDLENQRTRADGGYHYFFGLVKPD
jgi:hypothetical protein